MVLFTMQCGLGAKTQNIDLYDGNKPKRQTETSKQYKQPAVGSLAFPPTQLFQHFIPTAQQPFSEQPPTISQPKPMGVLPR
jgi:hypothetical protein